jgi:SAM-dependent methyltransferase
MAESEKSSKPKAEPVTCPICNMTSSLSYKMVEEHSDGSGVYFQCNCGVIFQSEYPSHDVYNEKYTAEYIGVKNRYYQQTHAAKTYAAVIEEATYGRRLLDVGFSLPDNMNFWRDRGWIVRGIELNPATKGMRDVVIGKFEDFPFKDKYNLIWMGHVLEHFNDPIKALKKAYDLMPEDGVLYISTPDIDFITKLSLAGWPHWKKKEHFVLWSIRALVRELEKIGFNIILKKRNFCSRYTSWFDFHIIAQKTFF